MLQLNAHCFMTSKDAYEIAKLLEEKEKTAKPGDSKIVKEWYCGGSLHTKILFIVDQDRATKLGLMK